MFLTELSRPKIGKRVTNTAFDYFKQRHPYNNDSFKDNIKLYLDINLNKNLNKLGWTKAGAGAYSSVYKNPNKSFVLKINKRPDKGYEEYVNVIKRYRNKHFPRISDMKVMKIGKDNYYVYLIEKLKALPRSDLIAFDIKDAIDALYGCDYKDMGESLLEYFDKMPLFRRNPDLIRAVYIVANNIGYNFDIDIHGGNIMKRADGTIVITDPYA